MLKGNRKHHSKSQKERMQVQYKLLHSTDALERLPLTREQLADLVHAIQKSNLAKFGLVKLSTLGLSLVHEIESKPCTLLEYAAGMRRDSIVSSLLRAGADPTVSADCPEGLFRGQLALALASVLPAFAVYIVCLAVQGASNGPRSSNCKLCRQHRPSLLVLYPCRHEVCRQCFWTAVMERPCKWEDMECPLEQCRTVLCLESEADLSKPSWPANEGPAATAARSRSRYLLLPESRSTTAPVKPVFQARSMRSLAGLYVGTYRSQRDSELFKAAEENNVLRLEALVEVGVDINVVNEYGQTAFFLACWKGCGRVAQKLLECGADADIPDHSNMHPLRLLSLLHPAVLKSLEMPAPLPTWPDNPTFEPSNRPVMTVLIPVDSSHPGAGSFTIDDFLSDSAVSAIAELCSRLPIAPPQKESCNKRSLYCDTLGWIQRAFREAMARLDGDLPSAAFAHMRFLVYDEPGGYLPAHTDLTRTVDGQTSTHTSIFYLTDCAEGGETVLLESLKGTTALATVQPRRGRLLCFPHICPHEARPTVSLPKILLRGEML
ncbi:uncharacterized protein BJ171DRAFT_499617 [Polychytrium aggregatum]|uniref:uncharacterized protein n=1 Tax=Polychytrium aggregatum TaxID=110093 RepID=UPI0022FE0F6D|nr:uncharacterized protein BJ171DRAFT_499617 [Polychytrium aggregatum]KAI9205794.1 hypothetical protein BJ171DRAFT_499617 [Polychytrium aggregatum]